MNTATILRGDAVTMLRTLPAQSVHCVVTSPPYWGLRDYGTGQWEGGDPECDHKEKDSARNDVDADSLARRARQYGTGTGAGSKVSAVYYRGTCGKCGARRVDAQLGMEPTPAEYVSNMVAVFAEVWRVLRDDGTLWLNVGDSYNGSGGAGGDYNANGLKAGQPKYPGRNVSGLKQKDLVGIPWRLALALQDAGWYLRSDVIWHKPNPMPESVTDRPTKAHEYVFLLTKSARYYYDAQAIAEPSTYPDDDRKSRSAASQKRMPTAEIAGVRPGSATYPTRNKRSVWAIATEPTPYAHFATMPTALAETCILAGCPAQACAVCGAPWVRVVEKGERIQAHWKNTEQAKAKAAKGRHGVTSVIETGSYQTYETIGFAPTCTCDAGTIPGAVLDPFAGSGTTLRVAVSLGRDGIGVELNPEYADLAERLLAQTQPALIAV